ncbi:MAG: Nif3-like dinuclear metal center hexameric protein [Solibacillus sp.]
MKLVNGHEVIQLFETWSPKKFACMQNDPIGLAVGTLNKAITKVLVTLDVTDEVVDEAIAAGCELIFAHHPPIFAKLSHLRTDNPQGQLFEKLIKHDIAVYAAHTNLDVAPGGVNDLLADALKLQERKIFDETYSEQLMKLAVFVPEQMADTVRAALAKAGAGQIGDYDSCSFTSSGEGRFRALDGATPFVGEVGALHTEPEQKIEVVFPQSIKNKILKAMLNAHPYEEPAYDFFTLDLEANVQGLGRIGKLAEPMTLRAFAEFVKVQLDVPAVRVVGDAERIVQKIAVVGGAGNSYVRQAIFAGADVFVTGDISFHVALDAKRDGLSIVDPGHHVEKVMIKGVAEKMTAMCATKKLDVEFIQSKIKTEPFLFI